MESWEYLRIFRYFKKLAIFSFTYRGTSTSFLPVKLAQKNPKGRILLAMVWVTVNIYDTLFISVNNSAEVNDIK